MFRPPNLNAVADAVERIRAVNMGTIVPTERDAPLRLARMLEHGTHAGMLVDQYYVKGVDVIFFGRKTKCNPLLARLAARSNARSTACASSACPITASGWS